MKKVSLLVAISILGMACGHLQKQEKISTQEAQQVTLALKEIGNNLQNYYTANNKWPEGNSSFVALKIKDPSTEKWKYDFICGGHACNVSAVERKSSSEKEALAVRMEIYAPIHTQHTLTVLLPAYPACYLWFNGIMCKANVEDEELVDPKNISASICKTFQGHKDKKGYCVLEGSVNPPYEK